MRTGPGHCSRSSSSAAFAAASGPVTSLTTLRLRPGIAPTWEHVRPTAARAPHARVNARRSPASGVHPTAAASVSATTSGGAAAPSASSEAPRSFRNTPGAREVPGFASAASYSRNATLDQCFPRHAASSVEARYRARAVSAGSAPAVLPWRIQCRTSEPPAAGIDRSPPRAPGRRGGIRSRTCCPRRPADLRPGSARAPIPHRR